jgi:hypothetical protein
MWREVLKTIDREHGLGCTFKENALTCELPNGSTIYLLGADSSDDEKSKLLGRKFALVVVDEAASFTTDLTDLVYGTLKPSVADYRGTIVLIGTPSNFKSGLFYELTQGQNPATPGRWNTRGWSGHSWSAFNNPHMAEKWQKEIDELIRDNPNIDSTSWYRQMYKGEWSIDDDMKVYKYQPGRNDYAELPEYGDQRGMWHRCLGVDLGYNDESSFVTVAYHDCDPTLYVEDVEKEAKLDLTDVAQRVKTLTDVYNYDTVIVDGANKQGVMEMRKRHGLALTTADKRAKTDFIDLMNADFTRGTIKLSPRAEALKAEYLELVWDERAMNRAKDKKRVELAMCKNHAADGALYVWRACIPYLFSRKAPAPKVGSASWYVEEAARMEQAALDRLEEQRAEDKANEEEWA